MRVRRHLHRIERLIRGLRSSERGGVYSTQPGIIASPHTMDDPRRVGKLPLAMIGIVPCKVSDENGAIQRGDLLVTSGTPGHAMKGTGPDDRSHRRQGAGAARSVDEGLLEAPR